MYDQGPTHWFLDRGGERCTCSVVAPNFAAGRSRVKATASGEFSIVEDSYLHRLDASGEAKHLDGLRTDRTGPRSNNDHGKSIHPVAPTIALRTRHQRIASRHWRAQATARMLRLWQWWGKLGMQRDCNLNSARVHFVARQLDYTVLWWRQRSRVIKAARDKRRKLRSHAPAASVNYGMNHEGLTTSLDAQVSLQATLRCAKSGDIAVQWWQRSSKLQALQCWHWARHTTARRRKTFASFLGGARATLHREFGVLPRPLKPLSQAPNASLEPVASRTRSRSRSRGVFPDHGIRVTVVYDTTTVPYIQDDALDALALTLNVHKSLLFHEEAVRTTNAVRVHTLVDASELDFDELTACRTRRRLGQFHVTNTWGLPFNNKATPAGNDTPSRVRDCTLTTFTLSLDAQLHSFDRTAFHTDLALALDVPRKQVILLSVASGSVVVKASAESGDVDVANALERYADAGRICGFPLGDMRICEQTAVGPEDKMSQRSSSSDDEAEPDGVPGPPRPGPTPARRDMAHDTVATAARLGL